MADTTICARCNKKLANNERLMWAFTDANPAPKCTDCLELLNPKEIILDKEIIRIQPTNISYISADNLSLLN